jgi:hypothetical protein
VVFTGTGDVAGTVVTIPVCDEAGTVVTIPVCEDVGIFPCVVVTTCRVLCGVPAGAGSRVNVTEAASVIVPVRFVVYDSCIALRFWFMMKVYVPRG